MNPLITDYPLSTARPPVIVALDFANEHDTLAFVRRLSPELCQLKIGKELFTATGRSLVEKLIQQGFKLFLDLKYHDIPNTVAQACKVAADMGVWLVDMHSSGGRRMMEAAAAQWPITTIGRSSSALPCSPAWNRAICANSVSRKRPKNWCWHGRHWRRIRVWTAWSAPRMKPKHCANRWATNS